MLDEKDKQSLQQIEDVTNNADKIQQRVLTEILSTNAHVEYLQRHGLNGSTDALTFKKLIPVVSYEQLKPCIERIANGDASPILCANPITEFFMSSGTSGGEPKLIPIFEEEFARRSSILNYVMPMMKQLFPGLHKGKGMYFGFTRPDARTKAGIVARPMFTSLCKRSHFKNMPNGSYTTPNDIILCPDHYQSLYCQLLCGLCHSQEVVRVGAVFAFTLIHAFKFLEKHWGILANDIRTGTLRPEITDTSVRESVMNILKPNPELADLVELECSKERWEGIIITLWPNTKYIDAIVTGSMSQYIPMLDYYSNGLPLICNSYGSSESFFGLNLNPSSKPEDISYTFIPNMAYFEFLPINRGNGFNDNSTCLAQDYGEEISQELVDLVDVKLGQEYELVVTTYAGLYRYCMGDILRVTGFKNKAPEFRFVCRKNMVLSLEFEKTDETELHNAVKEATTCMLSPLGATLVDYTTHANSSTHPGHYVLYWEVRLLKEEKISIIPSSIYEDCCLAIEESLNGMYRQARSDRKSIKPLEIKIVEAGTFEKLMERAVNEGNSSLSQYKTPRCVKSTKIIQLLDSRVVSCYFSQKSPKCDPNRIHHLLSL